MPDLRTPALALLLTCTTMGAGRSADEPRAILDAAIQAHGGERLAQAQNQVRAIKGTLAIETAKGTQGTETIDVPFTAELVLDLPEKSRATFDAEPGGRKLRLVLVVNGNQGWRVSAGAAKELGAGELEELREEGYVAWVETLRPLRDRAFTLAPLPESKVHGKAALGIKVTRAGHGDVELYFDRDSHLLVKMARQSREAKPVRKEAIFSEHKEFAGLKLPTHVLDLRNGKKATEQTITSYKFPARLDDGQFAKP